MRSALSTVSRTTPRRVELNRENAIALADDVIKVCWREHLHITACLIERVRGSIQTQKNGCNDQRNCNAHGNQGSDTVAVLLVRESALQIFKRSTQSMC